MAERTISKVKASPRTKAWDIECVGNHNFIGGKGLFLLHNTNIPEFSKLKQDNTMEAFRDRAVRVDVPYLLEWSKEIKVLNHDYGTARIKEVHIAPHTIEIAALVGTLSRLKDDKDLKTSLVEKAKLYDGRSLPGWNEDSVKELREKHPNEGLEYGLSARFLQNAIGNSIVQNPNGYVNPFIVLNEISEKLSILMINDENVKTFYRTCVELAKKELDEILKTEVQRALVADDSAAERIYQNYIDNIVAHCDGSKIKNPYTQREEPPDERLMRSIEEKAGVPEPKSDDWRRQITEYIGKQFTKSKSKEVRWDSHAVLGRAIERKLFEDTKDTIRLMALSSGAAVVDKDAQKRIEDVKYRMIRDYDYNEQSATDVLRHVSSIFARGDLMDDDN